MEFINKEEDEKELFEAHAHVMNQSYSFMKSMSLKCAVELGIPDIIHNHAKPMTLPELVATLPIHPSKAQHVHRLMRALVHSGFFDEQRVSDIEDQQGYLLTQASHLLLKDNPISLRPFIFLTHDSVSKKSWDCLAAWFQHENDDATPFSIANGKKYWEYAGENPRFNHLFNKAMASDSAQFINALTGKFNGVFKGLESMVDVGGGTGTIGKAIAEKFTNLKCTVFDLPHVIADLQGSNNLSFMGGDMFESIPCADAILLKNILHDWSDEDCVKILKQCERAITTKNEGNKKGKAIIIEMVVGNQTCDDKLTETQLLFDMQMMVLLSSGRERTEKEWAKIFFDAGFSSYTINPVQGLKALIELFP